MKMSANNTTLGMQPLLTIKVEMWSLIAIKVNLIFSTEKSSSFLAVPRNNSVTLKFHALLENLF